MSCFLIPETARLLIQEDLGVSDEAAYGVLLDSQTFGVAVHPYVEFE